MKRIANGFKQLKIKDLLSPFIFILLLIPSFIFRLINRIKGRKLWLVAENGTARDNGYHFFKYMRSKHPEEFCFYAINKTDSKCKELIGVEKNVIFYGSLKHWLFYLSANLNISNHKSGNPCPIFFYIIHVKLGLYKNRVFLQHGVIKDDCANWLHYDVTKFKKFITSAEREYEDISRHYGYPAGAIVCTGLARFDALTSSKKTVASKQILISPTWRNWLGGDTNKLNTHKNIEDTEYFKRWSSLLHNKKFIDYIEAKDIKAYFYPHIGMKNFLRNFSTDSNNIKIMRADNAANLQSLIKQCDLLVTDFSSVFMDFAYMEKPQIYYQFDEKEYRVRQLKQGYFSYEDDGFGDIIKDEDALIDKIIYYCDNKFIVEPEFSTRMKSFFKFHDKKNCERIYEAIR